jgi:predicted XRE-type DNA-binding protein
MRLERFERLPELLKHYSDRGKPLSADLEKGTVEGVANWEDKQGYLRVTLHKGGKAHKYFIHEIIAVLGGLVPVDLSINHIDCDKKNNSISNLEAIPQSRNRKHSTENKLDPRGEQNGMSVLTGEDVAEIRSLYSQGNVSQRKLAKMFGVTQANISAIVLFKTWKGVN